MTMSPFCFNAASKDLIVVFWAHRICIAGFVVDSPPVCFRTHSGPKYPNALRAVLTHNGLQGRYWANEDFQPELVFRFQRCAMAVCRTNSLMSPKLFKLRTVVQTVLYSVLENRVRIGLPALNVGQFAKCHFAKHAIGSLQARRYQPMPNIFFLRLAQVRMI